MDGMFRGLIYNRTGLELNLNLTENNKFDTSNLDNLNSKYGGICLK